MIAHYIACFLWGAASHGITRGRHRYGIPLAIAGVAVLVWLRSEGL